VVKTELNATRRKGSLAFSRNRSMEPWTRVGRMTLSARFFLVANPTFVRKHPRR